MIKLCTIDLDGTLLDQKKNISKENKEAIIEATNQGCQIVLASGRPKDGITSILQELELIQPNHYVICYNGAKILNTFTQETIHSTTISGKTVKEAYLESKRLNLFFHAFKENEELITDQLNPYTDVETNINHISVQVVDILQIKDDEPFLKCMIVGPDEGITLGMTRLNSYFYQNFSVVRSSKIFLEILNKNTNKGYALEALAKHLNIPMSETMAIGDAGNDIEMIKRASIGVAMANSFEEVKKVAQYETTSNEDSGVAKAIKKFILS